MKPCCTFRLGACLLLLAGLAGGGSLAAQTPAPELPGQFTPAQLDALVGPIALYPDALVALILPAATVPVDVVLAARYLEAGGGSADEIESQAWTDSVKALAHYPTVVEWMDQNLGWTQQIGAAFLTQRTDVMAAIQRQRAVALARGTLTSTPQMDVAQVGGFILIEPPQPDVIYVPCYNPQAVFYPAGPFYYPGPFLTFGAGFATGYWLDYGCDWNNGVIWVVNRNDRRRYWSEHRDWRHPGYPGAAGAAGSVPWHAWRPSPNRPRPAYANTGWASAEVVRPSPMAVAPRRPDGWRRPDERRGAAPAPGAAPVVREFKDATGIPPAPMLALPPVSVPQVAMPPPPARWAPTRPPPARAEAPPPQHARSQGNRQDEQR